jgi:hypothetical protein
LPPFDSVWLPAVERVAKSLQRRCRFERRLKILRHVRHRIMKAQNQEDVLDSAGLGFSALFGSVDICAYAMQEDGHLNLIAGRGPDEDVMRRRLEMAEGHLGYVARTRKAKYAPNLTLEPLPFSQLRSPTSFPWPERDLQSRNGCECRQPPSSRPDHGQTSS